MLPEATAALPCMTDIGPYDSLMLTCPETKALKSSWGYPAQPPPNPTPQKLPLVAHLKGLYHPMCCSFQAPASHTLRAGAGKAHFISLYSFPPTPFLPPDFHTEPQFWSQLKLVALVGSPSMGHGNYHSSLHTHLKGKLRVSMATKPYLCCRRVRLKCTESGFESA